MNILGSNEKLVCPDCGQDDLGFRVEGRQLYDVGSNGEVGFEGHSPEETRFEREAYCSCTACEYSGELRRFIGIVGSENRISQKPF